MNWTFLSTVNQANPFWDNLLRILVGAINVVTSCNNEREIPGLEVRKSNVLCSGFGCSIRVCG